MPANKTSGRKKRTDYSAKVHFTSGSGGLPKIEIQTAWSAAEIYPHGAHVTHFQRKNEPPLLFLSRESRFAEGQAIRGGIPVILPWFGAREGRPSHGFARASDWQLREIMSAKDGTVRLGFHLPQGADAEFAGLTADYTVTVGKTLELQLRVTNSPPSAELTFEDCLHTYFAVGDISSVSLTGLKGVKYLDKVDGFAKKKETAPAIKISSEVDRVYHDTTAAVEIRDTKLRRKIRVEKRGSRSTVVWNPWTAKAKEMADFGDDEYKRMVCVESGNVAKNHITLGPGKSATLAVKLSTAPWRG